LAWKKGTHNAVVSNLVRVVRDLRLRADGAEAIKDC
jgi:hypothetical protein